jgi:signal transduction histidine kinase
MGKSFPVLSLVAFLLVGNSAYAAAHAAQGDAMALVNRVILEMANSGTEKTIEAINTHDARFSDRDIYVIVYDVKAKELANGVDSKTVGTDFADWKDADGNALFHTLLTLLKTRERGWQDYTVINPKTKKPEHKSSYFQLFKNVVISCDITQ